MRLLELFAEIENRAAKVRELSTYVHEMAFLDDVDRSLTAMLPAAD